MRRKAFVWTVLALSSGLSPACKSAEKSPPDPIEVLGLDVVERVEINVHDEQAPPQPSGAWRQIDRQGLGRPTPRILGAVEEEFLDFLRTNSRASFNARWIDEGAVLPDEDRCHRITVRRVFAFSAPDEVRQCLPSVTDEELSSSYVAATERYELTVTAIGFIVIRSSDGEALRVVLDSISAYGDIVPLLRLVPDHEGVIPLAILLTLRSVRDEVRSITIVFDAEIPTTERILGIAPQESDWFPLGHESAPWSVQLTVFDQREVDSLLKDLDERLEPFLRLAGKAARAGLY